MNETLQWIIVGTVIAIQLAAMPIIVWAYFVWGRKASDRLATAMTARIERALNARKTKER